MKRIVYVIELDVPDDYHCEGTYVPDLFGESLVHWSCYAPLEDNAPIRLNITSEGVEEI